MITNKDVRVVVEGLVALGWRARECRHHVVVYGPDGRRLTVSTCHHVDGEYLKKIRNLLKRETENQDDRTQ